MDPPDHLTIWSLLSFLIIQAQPTEIYNDEVLFLEKEIGNLYDAHAVIKVFYDAHAVIKVSNLFL